MNKIVRFSVPLIVAFLFIGILLWLVGESSYAVANPSSFATEGIILVTTLEDELNSDGDCSLREAIEAANTNSPMDACSAGNSVITDTITFDVAGTIVILTQLEVTAGGPLVIEGENMITISGGEIVRLLMVGVNSNLTLIDLMLTDGFMQGDGGGIFNFASLHLINTMLSNNTANESGGGIYNIGSLTVINSILSGNTALGNGSLGGGIVNSENGSLVMSGTIVTNNSAINGAGVFNNGVMYIYKNTFSENYAYRGGGIYNSTILTITNSTISGNTADFEGGGINNYGKLAITNSTFSENTTLSDYFGGGGIINHSVPQAIISVNNSTFSGNHSNAGGGAIETSYGDSQITLSNSIVNDNDPVNCVGSIIDGNNNIENLDSCGFDPANGSMPNTDPLLGPLQDNGGFTWTHALLPGSPAIDAGDDAQCPPTDQRGVTRPLDGDGDGVAVCDIGSYEFEPGQLVVTTLDDIVDSEDGYCSLREAIGAANTNSFVEDCGTGDVLTDTITFNVAGIITVTSQLEVTAGGPLVIDGGEVIATSGADTTRVWWTMASSELTLQNLAVIHGRLLNSGAGLYNDGGNVKIVNSIFEGNWADNHFGGGIYNLGTLTIIDSNFYSNTATYGGGGGVFNGSILEVANSSFLYNDAYAGGGIYNSELITITNSTFAYNTSLAGGGLLNFEVGHMSITNSTISHNSISSHTGGGIENIGALNITNSTIFANSAPSGGGIYGRTSISLTNTIVAGNTGSDCDGLIFDGGHNISSDDSCNFDPANGSLPGIDPLLGPLQDNGGPTWTHALLQSSPAIDAGDDDRCPPFDQRGLPRPTDGDGDGIAICDIGSYEVQGPTIPPNTVVISGASEGAIGSVIYFTATVEPVSTTLPLTYVWLTSQHPPITHTSGLNDTAGWAWELPGTYAITVTASNLAGEVSNNHVIIITKPVNNLFLPLIINSSGTPLSTQAKSTLGNIIHVPGDYNTIQEAINASFPGDTIVVGSGTYYENINYLSKDITVTSELGPEETTIDGGHFGSVVNIGPMGQLTGFTITNGYAMGGGAYVNGGGTIIRNNIFDGNEQVGGYWGAAIAGNNSSPVIESNIFTNNSCDQQYISGVVAFVNGSEPLIINNLLLDNPCRAINMTIPAWIAPKVVNNTIVGNSVGIRVDARVQTYYQIYRNNIIVGNGIGLFIDISSPGNEPTWEYNLVYGNGTNYEGIEDQTGLSGNISEDPDFINEMGNDFHLRYGSPTIDAGTNELCPGRDYERTARPLDGNQDWTATCDMGMYEFAEEMEDGNIDGPNIGYVEEQYDFTAWVTPITATIPITYTWQASGQLPISHTGSISDTVSFLWTDPGMQMITLTAKSPVNVITSTKTINIFMHVYLPLVISLD